METVDNALLSIKPPPSVEDLEVRVADLESEIEDMELVVAALLSLPKRKL